MSIRFIASVFIVIMSLLITAFGFFCFMVPMDFYATVSGRVSPNEFRRVAPRVSGVVKRVIMKNEFQKGDVLLELEAEEEREALQQANLELLVLEKVLKYEKNFLAYKIKEKELTRRENAIKIDALNSEVALQAKQMSITKGMAEKLRTRRELEEDVKDEEANMMKELFKRKVVAKMEFLKIIHQARVAKIMSEQATMEADRQLFESENALSRLSFEKKYLALSEEILELSPKPERDLLTLAEKMLSVKGRISDLKLKISQKTLRAPFDGRILAREILPGQFIKQGEAALDIADTSQTLFIAIADQNFIDEIKIGQEALIALDNYPFTTHGHMKGRLISIQINLASPEAQYHLYLTLEQQRETPLEYGMIGQADIIIYHGAIIDYMSRKYKR